MLWTLAYMLIMKMGGTALVTFAFYFFNPDYESSVLLPFLYVAILVFDGVYLGATMARRERGAKRHNST